ncbi:hypothetical protein QJS10_CPB22g00410 [Acorus calamus]|uniref:Uncharacterized protein n=1 Tax=Acorus calamus TaxID=4465 RepID=A0AAV9BYG0_ACOCL|nr:hypothetical protein QJS10_CPB22g00410 [Acorus calamus]
MEFYLDLIGMKFYLDFSTHFPISHPFQEFNVCLIFMAYTLGDAVDNLAHRLEKALPFVKWLMKRERQNAATWHCIS